MCDTKTNTCFSVKVSQSETGFRFYRVRVSGRDTTVSIDPVLAEQLEYLLGSRRLARIWINDIANRMEAVALASDKREKRRAGLSRLVSREGWRFVLDPDHGHLSDLKRLGRTHPLVARSALSKAGGILAE